MDSFIKRCMHCNKPTGRESVVDNSYSGRNESGSGLFTAGLDAPNCTLISFVPAGKQTRKWCMLACI